MLYVFPDAALAQVIKAYDRPYQDPIKIRIGDQVVVDPIRSKETDIVGWIWCRGPDGREGWTPEAWLAGEGEQRTALRDFSALELTVKAGDQVTLLFSESGFVFCRTADGQEGWLPDGALKLVRSA